MVKIIIELVIGVLLVYLVSGIVNFVVRWAGASRPDESKAARRADRLDQFERRWRVVELDLMGRDTRLRREKIKSLRRVKDMR